MISRAHVNSRANFENPPFPESDARKELPQRTDSRSRAAVGVHAHRAGANPRGPSPATSETDRGTNACNSSQNAGGVAPSTSLVRVTHPFHPLSGRQFVRIGERYSRSGTRLLLEVDGHVRSIPRQWTDLVAPDPEVVIGEGRALFRLEDLMELARLVEHFGGYRPTEASDEV